MELLLSKSLKVQKYQSDNVTYKKKLLKNAVELRTSTFFYTHTHTFLKFCCFNLFITRTHRYVNFPFRSVIYYWEVHFFVLFATLMGKNINVQINNIKFLILIFPVKITSVSTFIFFPIGNYFANNQNKKNVLHNNTSERKINIAMVLVMNRLKQQNLRNV